MADIKLHPHLAKLKGKEKKHKAHTILLVDDEKPNLEVLRPILEEDYHVLVAGNGKEALELIQKSECLNSIHLIISDQRMPAMDGITFLAQTIPIIPKTKRIILTAYSDVEVIIKAVNQAQIYKFLLKPIDLEDLRLTVQRALEAYDLEILNESKDRFFSIVAHDLKAPLHSLLGYSDVLSTDIEKMDSKQIEFAAARINMSAKRLNQFLENLLEWARIQMKKVQSSPCEIDLGKMVLHVMDLLKDSADLKEIHLSCDIAEKTKVYADRHMLEVVLNNLLNNAIKFTEKGGRVDCSAQENGPSIEVTVKDTGVGMAKEMVQRLFRVESSQSQVGTAGEKGTGLGLVLCNEFIKLNRGTISAESQPGEGTTFRFTVPVSL
ncbi:MAG: hybrid sensor histidine kinase/response regulator [SAR324 cluster bacterium]|nr:hybrid sensor histidine kinase/response regulator [SAR324 cluster bacterium]